MSCCHNLGPGSVDQASEAKFNILANPQLLRPLGRKRERPESHGGPFKPGFWTVDPDASKVRM